jgi:hypothetical protein
MMLSDFKYTTLGWYTWMVGWCVCVCGGGGSEITIFYCIKYCKGLCFIRICLTLCLFHLHQVGLFNQQLLIT